MAASEKFCLRWNEFESSISGSMRTIREDKDFFDVTLACGDEQLQAHKVILSACSPFFRNILKRNPHQHPLVYLKGVKHSDLESVLNFMYHGEVNVAQEELNSFLAVAEDLKVKGLTQDNHRVDNRTIVRKEEAAGKVEEMNKKKVKEIITEEDDIVEVPVKSEPGIELQSELTLQQYSNVVTQSDTAVTSYHEEYTGGYDTEGQEGITDHMTGELGQETVEGAPGMSPSDLLQFVAPHKFEEESDKAAGKSTGYICTICGLFKHVWKANVRNHVESKHFKGHFVYRCPICLTSKNSKQEVYACKTEHNRNSRPLSLPNMRPPDKFLV